MEELSVPLEEEDLGRGAEADEGQQLAQAAWPGEAALGRGGEREVELVLDGAAGARRAGDEGDGGAVEDPRRLGEPLAHRGGDAVLGEEPQHHRDGRTAPEVEAGPPLDRAVAGARPFELEEAAAVLEGA